MKKTSGVSVGAGVKPIEARSRPDLYKRKGKIRERWKADKKGAFFIALSPNF